MDFGIHFGSFSDRLSKLGGDQKVTFWLKSPGSQIVSRAGARSGVRGEVGGLEEKKKGRRKVKKARRKGR